MASFRNRATLSTFHSSLFTVFNRNAIETPPLLNYFHEPLGKPLRVNQNQRFGGIMKIYRFILAALLLVLAACSQAPSPEVKVLKKNCLVKQSCQVPVGCCTMRHIIQQQPTLTEFFAKTKPMVIQY